MRRLLKDETDLDVEMAYQLASHGHNAAIGPSGFSPCQWVRGSSAIDDIPVGVNPRRAFDGMLKLKETARVAFEVESARSRLTTPLTSASKSSRWASLRCCGAAPKTWKDD